MNTKKDKITIYKQMRDMYRENENKFLTAFYQIRIVWEVENGRFYFHKKNDLEQHRDILFDLLTDILEINDVNFQKGIYYEVVLAKCSKRLAGAEEGCRLCRQCFENSGELEYVQGACDLHINSIIEIARDDIENAQLYCENLLTLLEMRYGINSWQYARMKLYIIGEYYYQYKRDAFIYEFKEHYDYFRQYAAEHTVLFYHVLIMYTWCLEENGDRDYEFWVSECERLVEQKQADPSYCLLKSKIGWIKAKILEKQKKDEEALGLLQEIITGYIEKDLENRNTTYAYVYLSAAYLCYTKQMNDQMRYYAEAGLDLCEELNLPGSELYYSLYNYIGIWYMLQHCWAEAEKHYSSCMQDILQKFGRENENYLNCIVNLIYTQLNMGKNTEVCFRELNAIKDVNLREKCKKLFNMQLNHVIADGMQFKDIEHIYKQCINRMGEDEDEQERRRLDVLYLSARMSAGILDAESRALLKNLEECYQSNFTDELALSYWSNRLIETLPNPQQSWGESCTQVAIN